MDMALTLIAGSTERFESRRSMSVSVRVEDVEDEASRRLRAAGIDQWRVREFITGRPAPAEIKHFEVQVEFAARAISRLSPIPKDFASDVYWPTYWAD